MNKLLTRMATAIVLVAILLVVFFRFPDTAAVGLLGVFVVAAAWEWGGFQGRPGPLLRVVFAVLIALSLVGLTRVAPGGWQTDLALGIGLVWWAIATVLVLRFPITIAPLWRLSCGLLVLLPAWVGMLVLLRSPQGGPQLLLLALAVVWAADIGAYAAGRRFGRHRLAPRVSPGKTWEGVGGGLGATAIVAWVGAWVLQLPTLLLVSIALIAAAISVVGDLTVSIFKRLAGLKDSGSLFPGHGGVLDRIDGVAAAMPIFALLARQTGLLAG